MKRDLKKEHRYELLPQTGKCKRIQGDDGKL